MPTRVCYYFGCAGVLVCVCVWPSNLSHGDIYAHFMDCFHWKLSNWHSNGSTSQNRYKSFELWPSKESHSHGRIWYGQNSYPLLLHFVLVIFYGRLTRYKKFNLIWCCCWCCWWCWWYISVKGARQLDSSQICQQIYKWTRLIGFKCESQY